MAHGRGVKGKRGIGSGSKSECTSPSKPASNPGYKKTGGDGMGGKAGTANPGKGKNRKGQSYR